MLKSPAGALAAMILVLPFALEAAAAELSPIPVARHHPCPKNTQRCWNKCIPKDEACHKPAPAKT